MRLNAVEVTQSLLAYTVETDKGSLIALLERNGVKLPANASDSEVIASALLASTKSQNFKNELGLLLSSKVEPAGEEFESFTGQPGMSFTGIDDFSFTGEEEFFNAPGIDPTLGMQINKAVQSQTAGKKPKKAPKAPKPPKKAGEKTKTGKVLGDVGKWFGQNVLTQENINAGIQIGLTSINNKVQNKANGIQNETNLITEKQDEIKKSQGKAGAGKLSTLAWVGIGVGVIAVIGVVIYLSKKK